MNLEHPKVHPHIPMDDVLILGGGVIGLSLAYELAGRDLAVRVIDRQTPGREASWAGAGILPPGNRRTAEHPYDELVGLSHELHPRWAAGLREETGIDNGYRRTGALRVACDPEDIDELRQDVEEWRRRQIAIEEVPPSHLPELEPALFDASERTRIQAVYHVPDEGQIRNPRHLKALHAACLLRDVAIQSGVAAEDFVLKGDSIQAVRTSAGQLTAEQYCVCSGAWSRALLDRLGIPLALKPIRGQMILLAGAPARLRHILNEGKRYIVARPDGRVLAGSTEEDAGFDKRTTAETIDDLLQFTLKLAPGLRDAEFERCWAGLRPGTADRLPYLGSIPGLTNGFIAAGHFRSGLQTSPGTAVVMAQLIRGERPEIDLRPFAVDRH